MLSGRTLATMLLWPPVGWTPAQDPALTQLKQADSLATQAYKLFDAKSWTEGNQARGRGIEAYRKAIELNPSLFEAHRRLGDLYRKNAPGDADLQHAADAYRKASELKPGDSETVSRLGIVLLSLGKPTEAIAAFEQASRIDPTVPMFQYNLGFTYAELMNLEAARKAQARLQPMDSALGGKLLAKIRKLSGEASLAGRPANYRNPKIELVPIPPGSFEMGGWIGGSMPVPGRKVTIKSGFYMGKYPVTQAQWQAVMGDNPAFFKSCGESCPVEQVSWHDAQAFVTRLNLLKDGYRYRLPSESEWEYAARGGTKTLSYADGDIGWHSGNSGSKTHPVGEKPANPFGLFDMAGLVYEWTLDWYASTSAATDAAPVVSGDAPMHRVLRGNSFYVMPRSVVTARTKGRIDEVSRNYGFRVAAEKRG